MEREWARLAAEGKTVKIEVRPIYGAGDARRPDAFVIDWSINGVGQQQKVFNNG